ncbi:hypothetical protein ThrDRAFT_02582 [Frankia casuarinae]|jgi:hypothetical protein|uniref:multiubiquitin domain-containing protein n=1 Tax=Frankia casuarinae (strain DSM 45818 / CECT 9043 / HFP020203 / CcI3) TaxID=106370 RepID=UPI0003115C06|nr:multiubiquitin domain-containing protein [Frankia casuarinae]EYT91817.1 hypothetical protein ThrDRAFT_02582 [Frankia casuarinae]
MASTAEAAAELARRPSGIPVTVNGQQVDLPDREVTGLEIKKAAIEQGVQIEVGFQLSVREGQRYRVIGDVDPIRVHPKQEFIAVAPDDNS